MQIYNVCCKYHSHYNTWMSILNYACIFIHNITPSRCQRVLCLSADWQQHVSRLHEKHGLLSALAEPTKVSHKAMP